MFNNTFVSFKSRVVLLLEDVLYLKEIRYIKRQELV